jgi:chromosome segregation ATPase
MDPQAVSHRPLIGSLVVLLKRLARKSVHWYVAPQVEGLRAQITHLEHCVVRMQEREEVRAWECERNGRALLEVEETQALLAELRACWETKAAAMSDRIADLEARIDSLVESTATEESVAVTLTTEIARLHHRLADLDAERIALQKAVHARWLLPDHSFNAIPSAQA